MEEKDRLRLKKLFEEYLEESLIQITFGNPVDREKTSKARVRPFLQGKNLQFQLERFVGPQAFHRNMSREEGADSLPILLEEEFRQCQIQSERGWAQVLVSRK